MPQPLKKKPKNVLVCCWGNVCRSPLAAAVLSQELGAERVKQCGVGPSAGGSVAAKKVREYAAGIGLDLSQHRSQQVTAEMLAWADVVVYMDQRNLTRLRELEAREESLVCLGSAIGLHRIADPAYTPRGPELSRILDQVVETSRAIAKTLK